MISTDGVIFNLSQLLTRCYKASNNSYPALAIEIEKITGRQDRQAEAKAYL